MSQIIPGILETQWQAIEKKLALIKPFSKRVHVDFLDGKFSPEVSFLDPEPFKKYKDDFFMEAHLMVDNPAQYLKPLADAGFKRFLGHIEKMQDIEEFVAEGQIIGEVGLALDSETQIDAIKIPFDDLDTILLMGVKAGKSGQVFLPETLDKIKALSQKSQIPIGVDGGVNEQTINDIKNAGATRFIVTSALFQYPEPMNAFEKLLRLVG